MATKHEYAFKCHDCGDTLTRWATADEVKGGLVPSCPLCGTSEAVKRVWTFGQFTFVGGLPSNGGRDPNKVWR